MSKKINYEDLVQGALVHVVSDLLKNASTHGLPGSHHFYITYNTNHPGVRMPIYLLEQYPESITIVIQYEFWDLNIYDDYFEITLAFNNIHEHLVVPFDAMTSFVDPSAKFGLQFTPTSSEKGTINAKNAPSQKGASLKKPLNKDGGQQKDKPKFHIPEDAVQGNVITLDAFRKH